MTAAGAAAILPANTTIAPAARTPGFVVEDVISEEFARTHYAGLRSLLERQIKDHSVASDILNQAVQTAIEHCRAGRVTEPERLAGYIYRVALNLYRNYRREFGNRADVRALPEEAQQIAADTPEGHLDSKVLKAVRSLIASLPTPRDREIVTRFYLQEEEKEAICDSLGLTPEHFDRVIFRARQRLRNLMEARGFRKSDLFVLLLTCCS